MTKQYDFNYKNFILYGIVFEIMMKLHRPFAVKFLERIGGSDLHISLFNSLPGFVMFLAVLPGAILIRRYADKKKITGILIFISRMPILLIAFIPMLPLGYQPIVFILLMAVLNGPNAVYMTSYQSFLGELFDNNERAKAIGDRNRYTMVAILIVTFLVGQILTLLPGNEAQRIQIYQLFFVAAFIMGMIELKVFSRFKVDHHHDSKPEKTVDVLRQVTKNKGFLAFMGCSLLYHFGWQMAWPLFNIYTIKVLGANESWLSVIQIAQAMVMFFGYKFWTKQIEKHGNPIVTAICTMGMAITPLLYILSKNLYVLTGTTVVSGLFTAGTITVLLTDLLEVTPQKDKVLYLGFYNTFINLSMGISPLVGHYFLKSRGIYFALGAAAFFRMIGSITFFIRRYRMRNEHLTEIDNM